MRKLKKEVWPYSAILALPKISSNSPTLVDDWCLTTVGKQTIDWYGYDTGAGWRVYSFKDEETLLIFKLTWGHYGAW